MTWSDDTVRGPADSQVRAHYEIEKQLAERLKKAAKHERQKLYSVLYEEMFRRVPEHPMLRRKLSAEAQSAIVSGQLKLLSSLLAADKTYLEIGPGDCALALRVAGLVKHVFAIDVSPSITKAATVPSNFSLIISDGTSIPVPVGSIDVAYSNQLMEHLHPEDALEQLQNIFCSLAPGGSYLCITPNRMNGPHDISRGFDIEATGFHLKEYTIAELALLFRKAGFSELYLLIGAKGRYMRAPIRPSIAIERLLQFLPAGMRQNCARAIVVRNLIEIRLLGVKPH